MQITARPDALDVGALHLALRAAGVSCWGPVRASQGWIEERLQYLAKCFSAEVAGYAVMSNHVHVIVRMDLVTALEWTDVEVARRWLSVYPRKYLE